MNAMLYLVAHAPAKPAKWFQPEMPEMPKANPNWHYCDPCKGDYAPCDGTADCQRLNHLREELIAWSKKRKKERTFQWPKAWAESVLQTLPERCRL